MSDTGSDMTPLRRALRRRHPHRGPRSTRRVIILSVLGGCAAIVLAGAAWVLVTGLLARAQLDHVRKELPQLRTALGAGDVTKARSISADLANHARRAHRLTTGPAWSAGAKIPILGTPLRTGRTIATASDDIGHQVIPGLLDLADTLTSTALRHGSAIDLRPIVSAQRTLTAASSTVTDAADSVRNASASWVPFVNSGQQAASKSLDKLQNQVTDAARAVQTLLPMLGESKVQRYFVGLQNEAQARGLGGLPGAFAIVTADHGKLTFTHFENDNTLLHLGVDLDFGADFAEMYKGPAPTQNYGNSTFSPNFPYAARIWAAMWEKKTGEHIDGALALDPTALSYLLNVTGPATLPTGQRISSGNIVALTQKDLYRFFSDDKARKRYLIDIADGVSHQLLGGHGDTKRLLRAAGRAASQRRLVLWSASPAVEANLVRAGFAGVVDGRGEPFAGLVVNNLTGSKLDYYLGRTMTYHRTGCGSSSTAIATIRLTNSAPKSGLPRYVLRRDLPPGIRPSDNRLLVTYYGSAGATVRSVTVDGKTLTPKIGRENHLVTATVDIEIPAGATVTVIVALDEPASSHPVQLLEQPLVQPVRVTTTGATCG
jgi:Protein of unknown function (DUF4012)